MSLRERLLARRLPPTWFRLRVEFTAASDEAASELEAARRALHFAETRGADLDPHKARLDAAEAAFEPFCERLEVKVLPPDEFDRIRDEHLPTDEQRTQGYEWDPVRYPPALLEACIDGDMTADDWAELRTVGGRAAAGEFTALFNVCLAVNDRTPDIRVGKG